MNTNSTKLASGKLFEFNRPELCRLLEDEEKYKFLVGRVSRSVQEPFPNRSNDASLQLDETHVISTLKWAQTRIKKLDDSVTRDLVFLWVVPTSLPIKQDQQCLEMLKIAWERPNEHRTFEKESLTRAFSAKSRRATAFHLENL